MSELGEPPKPDNLPEVGESSSLPEAIHTPEEAINTLTPYLQAIDQRAAEIKAGTNLGYNTRQHSERSWRRSPWKKVDIRTETSWQNTRTVGTTQFTATSTLYCPEESNYVTYEVTQKRKDVQGKGAKLTITNNSGTDVVGITYQWGPESTADTSMSVQDRADILRILQAQGEFDIEKAREYTLNFNISSLHQTPSLNCSLHWEDGESLEEGELRYQYGLAKQSLVGAHDRDRNETNTDIAEWGRILNDYKKKRNHDFTLNSGAIGIDDPQPRGGDLELPYRLLQATLSMIPTVMREDAETGRILTLATPGQIIL